MVAFSLVKPRTLSDEFIVGKYYPLRREPYHTAKASFWFDPDAVVPFDKYEAVSTAYLADGTLPVVRQSVTGCCQDSVLQFCLIEH